MKTGDQVEFTPARGKKRQGTVERVSTSRQIARVQLEGDPFPVNLPFGQLQTCNPKGKSVSSNTKVPDGPSRTGEKTTMPTSAKELRKQAQALGVENWQDLGRDELAAAVEAAGEQDAPARKRSKSTKARKSKTAPKSKPAANKKPSKKATTKKATAKKSTARKAAPKKAAASKTASASYTDPPKGVKKPKEAVNPFRKGSNLHVIYSLLVPKGGSRERLANKLAQKVELHPYSGEDSKLTLGDYDKRVLLAAQTLRDRFGYTVERQGRGMSGSVRVFIAGSADDPRLSNGNGAATKPRKKAKSKS